MVSHRAPSWDQSSCLAMVNDAANDIQHRWKYVDDLSVVEIVPRGEQSNLQSVVNELVHWCDVNDMKLNPSKCMVMQISFLRNPVSSIQLHVNGLQLEAVSSLKLLGITI